MFNDDHLNEIEQFRDGRSHRDIKVRGKLLSDGLIIPPPEPAAAKRAAVQAVVTLGAVESAAAAALAFWAASTTMNAFSLALLSVVLAAVVFLMVFTHCYSAARQLRHARRWHTEPLYRARWENEE